MSIFASLQPMASLVFLCSKSFPSIPHIRKGSVFLPCGSSQRIISFVMMLLPQLRFMLVTSRIWTRCTKHHVLLRQVITNTNVVRTNFDSFHHFCIRFFASVCEILSVMSSCLRKVSVSMPETICPSFPVLVGTSVECFELSCVPVQCSCTTIVFTRLGTSVQQVECC